MREDPDPLRVAQESEITPPVANLPPSSPDVLRGDVEPFVPGRPAAFEGKPPLPLEVRREGGRIWRPLLWVFGVCLLAGAVRLFVPYLAEQISYSIARGKQRAEWEAAGEQLQSVSLHEVSHSSQLIWKRISPAVVHLTVHNGVGDGVRPDMPLDRFHSPDRFFAQGQGSGVIVSQEGYILTNHHVVQDADRIDVHLADHRHVPAELLGVDELTDLAVLKIPGEGLTAAEWGDSDALEIGASVWAAGSPFGLEGSFTSGILSGKNRSGFAGKPHQDFLQTDVAVNPGNSGGPLVNDQGKVVGINTAIVGQSYKGISFAIPSSVAQSVFERLKTHGRVPRGWLGLSLDDVTAERAKDLGLPDENGAVVMMVVNDASLPSPCKAAGILAGDVIRSYRGQAVENAADLIRRVAATAPGTTVELLIFRKGQELKISVTLAERPARLKS